MDISVELTHYALKIRFGTTTHLRIDRDKYIGHHAWRDYGSMFCIEFMTNGGSLRCEYDSKEKWTTILAELDRALDGEGSIDGATEANKIDASSSRS